MGYSPEGHKESDTAEATEHTRNLKITANHKRAYHIHFIGFVNLLQIFLHCKTEGIDN